MKNNVSILIKIINLFLSIFSLMTVMKKTEENLKELL